MINIRKLFDANYRSLSGKTKDVVSGLDHGNVDKRWAAHQQASLILNDETTSPETQSYIANRLVDGLDDHHLRTAQASTRGLKRFIASDHGDKNVKAKIADGVMQLVKKNANDHMNEQVMSAAVQLSYDLFKSGVLSDEQDKNMTDMLFNGLDEMWGHVAGRFAGELSEIATLPLSEKQQDYFQTHLLEELQTGKHSNFACNISKKWMQSEHVDTERKAEILETYENIMINKQESNAYHRINVTDIYLNLPYIWADEKEEQISRLAKDTNNSNSDIAYRAGSVLSAYMTADETPVPLIETALSALLKVMNKKRGRDKADVGLDILTYYNLAKDDAKDIDPDLENQLQAVVLNKWVSKYTRSSADSTDDMAKYLSDNPAASATFMQAIDLQVNQIDITQSKPHLKTKRLGQLANLVKDVANSTDALTSTSSIHISDQIGSNDAKAVIIVPPSGPDQAVAAIRCQTRPVYGASGMQERVVDEYGSSNSVSGLEYFAQYAKFLSLKPENPILENTVSYQRLQNIALQWGR